jgi:hypothetical protein
VRLPRAQERIVNKTELESIEIGDSVLGAFGELSEHTVAEVRELKIAHKTSSWPTTYRDVWLDDGAIFIRETRLLQGGPEVLIRRRPKELSTIETA